MSHNNECHYHLYYSERAGAGKTHQIFKDFEAVEKKENDKLHSFFIDVGSNDLPVLDKKCDFIHYDLSPDLFDNDYRFFDKMWVFSILRYHIRPDGNEMITPRNIFFEVPTLTKKQYPDGGFISEYDFPIYVDEYHKISVKDDEKVGIKDVIHHNSFYNIIKYSDIKVELPEAVKIFCPKIFGKEINFTDDLLLTAAKIFYKDFVFERSNFIPRILEEFNLFMKEFCEGLQIKEEKSLAIFILLLRTNFHVWNFESLFDKQKQPKSFIIMANQNLFSNKPDRNKWNLLCFSSNDEKIEWDTSHFSEFIQSEIGIISDSTILDNNLFTKLKDDKNIVVYSNHLNYVNDQIYFFNIIRSFFYSIDNPKNKYSQITDGVILNNFKQSEKYEKLQNHLTEIYEGKSEAKYIQNWTNELDSISEIFQKYKLQPKDLLDSLTKKEEVKSICNMTLTMTIVKRFVIMIIRIILKQPIIFEGFTGVGKTLSVQLLSTLIKITPVNKNLDYNNGFSWSYHQIDCHGALQLDEVLKTLDIETNKSDQVNMKQIFFFDELNTSPVSSYIINEMNNYYMKSKYYKDKSIVFIAAINPYLKINFLARSLSRVGIKQIIPNRISKLKLCRIPPSDIYDIYECIDLNKLAYNVRELSYSSKMIVLQSDPEFFQIDDNVPKESEYQNEQFYPPDESETVHHIIMIYLNNLMDQTYKSSFKQDNAGKTFLKLICPENKENLNVIHNTIKKFKKNISIIIHKLLSIAFIEIRELMQLKSILSYRDVKRCMQFFIHFLRKLANVYIGKDGQTITEDILIKKIIPQSIVLSMMISIVFRFSGKSKVDTSDGYLSTSVQSEEEILSRFHKFGLQIKFSNDRSYYSLDIRSTLLKKLTAEGVWLKPLKDPISNKRLPCIKQPGDWIAILRNYSWLKCAKYVYDFENKDLNDNSSLFKLNTLLTHLFAISSCYSCSKNDKGSVIPCLIIGMPGTSKTLAIQKFIDYKSMKGNKKDNFFSSTYLSTRISEAEGLNSHYRDCASFMLTHKDSAAVCVIDELGLANLNETRPLKLLHYYFDKGIMMNSEKESTLVPVMSIASSNYALDFANMNRGILICTDLPTDEDISKAFCLSEKEAQKVIITSEELENFKKNYFKYNNFIDLIEDTEENNKKYVKFLEELWTLTPNKERPEMLTLRPLYLLFNTIFHSSSYNDFTVGNLCLYLISAISCSPSDSFEKLKLLIKNLIDKNNDIKEYREINEKINEQKYNNYNAFKQIFLGTEKDNYGFYKKFCEIVKAKAANPKENEYFNDIQNIIDRVHKKDKNKNDPVINSFKEFKKIIRNPTKNAKYKNINSILMKIAKNECFKELTHMVNNPKFDNYKLLRQKIIEEEENVSKRAFCLRTRNYECFDFIKELLERTTKHYQSKKDIEIRYVTIYPSDFKLNRQVTMDEAIQITIEKIQKNDPKIIYYMLIIGNVTLTDALLDLLNAPNENKASLTTRKPLISQSGFSVQLKGYPSNIVFCFIMNEKDFLNRNSADSFPIPLLDRLNHFYLDYDQLDEFGIIEKWKNKRNGIVSYSTPFTLIIRDYLKHFVTNVSEIPKYDSNTNKKILPVVFSTTDLAGTRDCYLYKGYENKIELVNLNEDEDEDEESKKLFNLNHDFVVLSITPDQVDRFGRANKNLKKLKNLAFKNNIELKYYCSNEYDKLYNLAQNPKCDIFFPLPSDYNLLDNDGSINKLIKDVRNNSKFEFEEEEEEEEEAYEKQFKGIILTLTPMMEGINYDPPIELGIKNYEENEITTKKGKSKKVFLKKTIVLYDSEITSLKDLNDKINNSENASADSIIFRLNQFQIEHDRLIRDSLIKTANSNIINIIIIYHLKANIIPEGLYSSKEWPLFWIESVSQSPTSNYPSKKIVDSILFKKAYENNREEIFKVFIKEKYDELKTNYDIKIENRVLEKRVPKVKTQKKVRGVKVTKEIPDYLFDLIYRYSTKKFKDNHELFEGLIEDIKDECNDKYLDVDIKRKFFDIISEQMPLLVSIIRLFILNAELINDAKTVDEIDELVKKLAKGNDSFDYNFLQYLFDKSEIETKNYGQHKHNGIFFPELIFPEILKIYNTFISKNKNHIVDLKPVGYDKIDMEVISVFCSLQKTPFIQKNISLFCYNYLMDYLKGSGTAAPSDLMDIFIELLNKLLEKNE